MEGKDNVTVESTPKQKKPKQIRATLAIGLAVLTLFTSLLGATLISKSVAASETQEVITTEVEYKIQQVMDSPPVQEMLASGGVDEEALRKDIIDTVTADVLSKAMRQWQQLSAEDMDALEDQLADIIANSFNNSVSNFDSEEVINKINEELNISTDTSLIDEEWLVQLITDTVTTLVEQTLVDVLTEQMTIIDGDLQVIQDYIDTNLDTIYGLITENSIAIENMKLDITKLQEQIDQCATQEDLFNLTVQLETLNTEFTVAQSNNQVQLAFLESTLAQYYNDLLTMCQQNATDITNLTSSFNEHVVESTNQINQLNNTVNEMFQNSSVAYNEKLELEIARLTKLIEEKNTSVTNQTVENMEAMQVQLTEIEQNLHEEIQLVKDDLNVKIDENRHKTENNITYVDNKITEDLDETDNRLTDELNETAHNIYNDMNDLDENINITIDSLAYNIYNDVNSLDQDIINAFKNFNDNSFKNFSTLHAYTKSVEDCLNYNVQNIEKITNSNTAKTETWIEELDARQQKNLTTVANQLNTNIGTMSTYIKSEVDTAINTLNSNITNEIGAKFSSFATSTATAVNNLGSSVETVFKGMGDVVKVSSFNQSTGVLYLTSTNYSSGSWGTVTKPSLTAPTIKMATVTLGQMGALPTIEVRDGQVYVNGSLATNNSVTDPTLDKIQYQDKVVDPTTGSFIESGKDASNPEYDPSVTNPEDRDYQHTDYEDGTYDTITWDEQGNIDGEVETFGTTP